MDLSRADHLDYRLMTLRRNWAICFIFFATVFENCAFSALTFTFIPYFTPAFVQTYVFLSLYAIAYFVAFVTGFVSDSTIGRFKLICAGYICYVLGYSLMFLSVNQNPFGCPLEKVPNQTDDTGQNELQLAGENCATLYYVCLTLSACGAGCIWGNSSILGADQAKDENLVPVFYHSYYFFRQVGITIACFGIFNADIDSTNWLMTGGLGSILLSFFLFLMGREVYESAVPDPRLPDNPAVILFTALKAAIAYDNRRRFTDMYSSVNRDYPVSRLDLISIEFGGTFTRLEIDAVKRYIKLFYVFLTLVTFEIVYIQQLTTFRTQGLHMKIPSVVLDTQTTPPSLTYPVRWFSSGYNLLTLLVLIPMILLVSYLLTNYRISLTMETVTFRLTVGMIFSALSMFSAGAVEVYRVLGKDGCDQSDGECHFEYVYQGILYEASEMSIIWQAPQFVFAALAEIFVHITTLQLAYLEAPTTEHSKMHGLFLGILQFASTLGTLIAMISLASGKTYSCKEVGNDDCNPNDCKLYVYFFVLGVVQLVGVAWNKVTVENYFKWTATGQGFCF